MHASSSSPRHYLDHAATSPLRDCARQAWLEASTALNPGAHYLSGRKARAQLEQARETIAHLVGCEPIEIVFTGSSTEANNIALRSAAAVALANSDTVHIAASPIEHPAVAVTLRSLAEDPRIQVDYFPVNPQGIVDDFHLLDDKQFDLVTLMWANNETGAIQPVEQLGSLARARGMWFHSDATQAVGKIPVDLKELEFSSLAFGGHKYGGPRGIGVLVAPRSFPAEKLLTGGGQERKIRAGTPDVAQAVALAAALSEAVAEHDSLNQQLRDYATELTEYLTTHIDDVVIHTPAEANSSLAGHIHLSFPGADTDSLMMLCDAAGLECSSGSACHAGVNRPSEVLLAMGVDESLARSTCRITLGHTTTRADIDAVKNLLPQAVAQARIAGSL